MKRDMELVRDLLLKIEAAPGKPSWQDLTPRGDDAETERIVEHLGLIKDAGLIKSIDVSTMQWRLQQDIELTWEGHEFLDDIRDPEIWKKAKEKAGSMASVGVSFMWELAKAEIKTKLGLP